ncbi:peptidoglycan DD-metalloendopeptidase family protein [Pelagibius sp.]|uniref:peptidoglycan DD-metalloendopeptidase family protein n=1 Tax=Pelagibius sp. TaxID=1931238 RepID=UPI00260725ED|nr:peptidoglycan DD-metalloendopeptidase family protein [Pelagibius sp.]
MTLHRIAILTAVALALSACNLTPVYRDASFQTPKDPPQLPQRKPAPPANFAALSVPFETAAAPQAGTTVTVETLAPLGAAPQAQAAPLPRAQQPLAQQPLVQQPLVQPAAAQVQPVAQPLAQAIPADGRYVVAQGDSLYGIARRFGLPIRAVIDANGLQPPYRLALGQGLTIPQAQVHVVAPGDTVFNIARRYQVDRSELVRLNGIDAPYTIPLGQKLILPQPGSSPAASVVAATAQPRAGSGAAAAGSAAPGGQTAALPKAPPGKTLAPAPQRAQPAIAKRGTTDKPPPRAQSTFLWPVQGPVLSSFGGKADGVHNDGINIAAPRGTPVRAAENGVVAYAGEELKGFGKLLLVKHADGWITAYAHNEKLLVVAGDVVSRGQTIARVGSSGSVGRPQLHFEVRRGTRAVNPETMLGPRPTTAAKPATASN